MNFEHITRAVARLAAPAFLGIASAALAPAHAADVRHGHAASHPAGDGHPRPIAASAAEGVWTCPMHPEIHAHGPGKCPICKMKLVKVKRGSV